MKTINIQALNNRLEEISQSFNRKSPFKYVVFDNFFDNDIANEIYSAYPTIKNGKWDGTTYIDQKNKFQKTKFETDSLLDHVFKDLNGQDFIDWLQNVTDISDPLVGDQELFGGGLHQSTKGAYLNVHVDYNIHPSTKFHRRLNVLIYMNQNWQDEFEGHLELWDIKDDKKELIEKIAPVFNRCVIFETNEISYHGHPKPLNTPKDVNRKSLATYYYTENRPSDEIAEEHNTKYINTQGKAGQVKRLISGIKAIRERLIGF